MRRIGSPIRDASVDPRPEDHQPPTNAGEANPHGPLVVSVQPSTLPHGRVPAVGGRVVVEGQVDDDATPDPPDAA